MSDKRHSSPQALITELLLLVASCAEVELLKFRMRIVFIENVACVTKASDSVLGIVAGLLVSKLDTWNHGLLLVNQITLAKPPPYMLR